MLHPLPVTLCCCAFVCCRASAYDVFAPGILAQAAQAAANNVPERVGSRRPSFRVPPPDDSPTQDDVSPVGSPVLTVEDDRRIRRRGSQL